MSAVNPRSSAAGRQIAVLFGACGLLALIDAALPGTTSRSAVVGTGIAELVAAGILALLRVENWSETARMSLPAATFALIGISSAINAIPPRAYGQFFVLTFAWIGFNLRPGASLKLLAVAVSAYIVPLVVTKPDPPFDLRALLLTMGTCIMVAETIAHGRRVAARAEASANRAASTFRTVARTSSLLKSLEPQTIVEDVLDGVMKLGYDSANLSVLDPATETFHLAHVRGRSQSLAGGRYPAGQGLAGQVRERNAAVVVPDYQRYDRSIEDIRAFGFRGAIGVPVRIEDELVGVLVANSVDPLPPDPEDVEALQVMAEIAGTALANARDFQQQRNEAKAALTDELTGLANRRQAVRLIEEVRPGDSVAVVDMDHFRQINEKLGHAGGDEVLRVVANHLAAGLRTGDHVFRYGGEEFLLILPKCGLAEACDVVDRLMAGWRKNNLPFTFSAGLATHTSDRSVQRTIEAADLALYAAKHAGRDCYRRETEVEPVRSG